MLGWLLDVGATSAPSSDPPGNWVECLGGGPTTAGERINEDKALTVSAVVCSVNLISNAVAGLPWQVFRRGDDATKTLASEHPVYRLLHRRPNPNMGPSRLKRLLCLWRMLWGNGRAEIERDGRGNPVNLWPIHPTRVRTIRDPDRAAKLGLESDVFHQVYDDHGQMHVIEDSDMFHAMGTSKDGVTGLSLVGLARESLGLTVAADRYGAAFFGNSAMPSLAMVHPKALKKPARDNLRRSWLEAYGGRKNRGVAVLEEGVEIKQLSMPNEDSQFLETRTFQVLEWCRMTNIPPHKLMEQSHATFTNIGEQRQEYVSDAVMPYVVDLEEEGDRKLFRGSEQDVLFTEFNMSAALRSDVKTRMEAYEIERRNGVLTANGWLRRENENPIEGPEGDLLIVEANMVSLADLAAGRSRDRGTGSQAVDDRAPGETPAATKVSSAPVPDPALAVDVVRSRIVETYEPLIAECLDRMARVAARAQARAKSSCAKKPDSSLAHGIWLAGFVGDHAPVVRLALAPIIDAMGGMVRLTLPGVITDEEWDRFVGAATKALAETYLDMLGIDLSAGTTPANSVIRPAVGFLVNAMSEWNEGKVTDDGNG